MSTPATEITFADLSRWSLRPFLSVTRPRVLALVLVTAIPILFIEQASVWHSAWILLGTALTGAACSVLNAWMERDIDARMRRTRNRPVVVGDLSVPVAVSYGVLLSVVSTALLWAVGGSLAALTGAATIAFYVFVYTGWLKRRTPQNIVIGGAAGATAPLIADVAVDGTFGWASLVLFLIVFLWTPAHFWAIALYRKREYEAAEIPMMPSVVGEDGTRVRMLGYGIATVATSLAFLPLGLMGTLYGVAATILGAGFLLRLVQLLVRRDNRSARTAFMASNYYLLLLFAAMVADIALASVV